MPRRDKSHRPDKVGTYYYVAPFSLVARVTQLLQSNQCLDFCPQRFSLFDRPGIEACEQMN